MIRRPLGLLLVPFALLACGSGADLKQAGAVRTDIHTELGVDSHVNLFTANGVTTVTVTLASLHGDPAVVKGKVKAIVKRHIPSATDVIVIATL